MDATPPEAAADATDEPGGPAASPPPTLVAEVILDDEAGVARLRIPGSLARNQATTEAFLALARQSQIAIDPEVEARVADAARTFRAHPDTVEHVIAERVDPLDGTDGWIEWMEGYAPIEGADPADADDRGRVDHYNRVSYIKVAANTHVATIHPPARGEEGRDVRGRALRPEPGRPCDIRVDRTLDVNGGRVVTRGDGVLEFANRAIRVSRLLEVKGCVDFSTGNIDFDGSVHVGGGIRDRFAVRTTETLVVHGLIQSARLECGGNLVASTGMAGRDRGSLNVDGSVEARYLDNVRGTIAGDLVIERELVNCRLDVGGELHGDRAVLVGGDSTVRYSVRVGQIGNAAERATTLVVGRVAVVARIGRLLARLGEQHATLVEQHGEPSVDERPGPRRRRRRGGAEERILDLRQRIAWCRSRQKELEAAQDATEVVLEVGTIIHPGTRLLVGPFEVMVRSRLAGPLRIEWLDRDEPYISSGGAPAHRVAEVAETHLRAA